MRAVALSDDTVQEKISASFIPLKIIITPGTEQFPVDWPALANWRSAYQKMGGPECQGITGCTVVSPDLAVEFANTGSAFVWEMFDSIAYDPVKFAAMLDRGADRAATDRQLRQQTGEPGAGERLQAFRTDVAKEMKSEGRFKLPPRGFTVRGAKELFRMTGDLPLAEKGADSGKAKPPAHPAGKGQG